MCHSCAVALFLTDYPSSMVHDSRCCEGLHAFGLSPATLGLLSCCLTSLGGKTTLSMECSDRKPLPCSGACVGR